MLLETSVDWALLMCFTLRLKKRTRSRGRTATSTSPRSESCGGAVDLRRFEWPEDTHTPIWVHGSEEMSLTTFDT